LINQAGVYLNFIRSRRSIRYFSPEAVSQDVLEQILETAACAPSAHNRQPWRFVIVHSNEAKIKLADDMGAAFRLDLLADGLSETQADAQVQRSRKRILEAPVVAILCLDRTEMDVYPDTKRRTAEHMMAVQSVALAGGTFLLAAHAEGLGGVWVCAPLFAPQAVQHALETPPDWEPQGMLLIGYPAKIPEVRPRKPVHEMTRFI
jgi:coenzyme F420-0:L-glutamate ligase/coenzyme F420-1:gamma-L-glutamate ligase